ncbi:HD domain-containing protein [Nocardia sp. NBC_01503]|uniref:HD domain-containing protein n=1 Tax=Nocardia sp. NBC_01503 TaxID=2975997 RepID=UPI002E7B567B|nr:HD domain-containing protein [Nocardia sp. NBC_01503]WTL29495.1 HD domain-containing protein [Nocardia sp. NBC_01503]
MTSDLRRWAFDTAREQLETLPRRWKHTQGVARRAEHASGVVDDPDLLVAAAWLHDVGYAPHLARTGFHPVDGAEFLAEQGAPERLIALVAHHSCACVEARHRGLKIRWADDHSAVRDALWWADMTTTPAGEITDVCDRIEEVLERYGPDHVVARSVTEASAELLAAGRRTEKLLADRLHV